MVTAHPVANKQKAVDLCNAFLEGAPAAAHGHVFYGVNSSNFDAWQRVRQRGEDWYSIDNSYFDEVRSGMNTGGQFRITKNAWQCDVSRSVIEWGRFDALGISIRPMRDDGRKIIVVEQSAPFMELMKDKHWLQRATAALNPRDVVMRPWSAKKLELQASLISDLYDARMLITHSSAAAVTAYLRGVNITVSKVSALFGVRPGEREHAARVLACSQFTIDEIRNGKAWSWLNEK